MMNDVIFKEGDELLEWGPVPGVLLTLSLFMEPFIKPFEPPIKGRWPKAILLMKKGRLIWLNDMAELREEGERMFTRYVLADGWRGHFNDVWQKATDQLVDVMQKIDETQLSSLTDQQLAELAEKFHRAAISFEAPTVPPELANYGAEGYFRRRLEPLVPAHDLTAIMHILTAPEQTSFNHREEIDLFNTDDLDKHQQKYFWLQNGFGEANVLPVSFFEERKRSMSGKSFETAAKMINDAQARKEEVQRKFGLPDEIMTIASEIWQTVVMQDKRKRFNYVGVHYADLLMRETAQRFNYPRADLLNAWFDEIVRIIKGEDLHEVLIGRRGGYGIIFDKSGWQALSAARLARYWQRYVDRSDLGDVQEIKGTVACSGRNKSIVGRVRVVYDPRDADKFKEGEVMVAVMTSPDFVVAMRKAAAIVTNFGGLTSHAAIVARELNKPCIIGTKIATKVLHDGDEVEVDADKGLVRILNK